MICTVTNCRIRFNVDFTDPEWMCSAWSESGSDHNEKKTYPCRQACCVFMVNKRIREIFDEIFNVFIHMRTFWVNHRNVLSVRSYSSTEFDKCIRRWEHTRRVMYLLVTASADFSFPKWLKSHLAKIFTTNIDAHVS